eukprot:746855-Hanusia_phi.AAC.5
MVADVFIVFPVPAVRVLVLPASSSTCLLPAPSCRDTSRLSLFNSPWRTGCVERGSDFMSGLGKSLPLTSSENVTEEDVSPLFPCILTHSAIKITAASTAILTLIPSSLVPILQCRRLNPTHPC